MTGWICAAVAAAVAIGAVAAGRRPTGLGWLALLVLLGLAAAAGVVVGRGIGPQGVGAPRIVDVPPASPRPISDDELRALVIDLRTASFPTDQLALLVQRARPFTFTPTQAARVLLCFSFDDHRLGALEVLAPRIDRTAPLDPVLDAFRGPFGSVGSARMILGLP